MGGMFHLRQHAGKNFMTSRAPTLITSHGLASDFPEP
jgi:hypothetical protein